MTMRDNSGTQYQREIFQIAKYNDNREPDGAPDEVVEVVRYSEVTEGEVREVTDEAQIAEIERKIREDEDNATDKRG